MNKPNILLLLCDQMRRHAPGVYGNPDCRTPHLDALANCGVRFDRAYSTYPICVPFRHTLMTGVSGHQANVPSFDYTIPEDRRTLADEFNDAGYETALFGKWHLSAEMKDGIPEPNQGRWQTFVYSDGFPKYDGLIHFTDPRDGKYHKEYDTDLFTNLAIDWLETKRDTDKPFCLNVSLSAPHDVKRPHEELYGDDPLGKPDKFFYRAPPAYMDRWKDREVKLRPNFGESIPQEHHEFLISALRGYYAMIEHLDDAIGRIIDYLKASGLYDNTIIMFVSDHGDLVGSHCAAHKGIPYEESTGIPLIVAGPGIDAGRVLEQPVHTEDLFPSLLGLCGLAPQVEHLGKDFSPLVYGTTDNLGRDGVFLEFVREDRPDFKGFHAPWRGYVTERYKYAALELENGDVKPWMLFDLEKDPFEQNNLCDDPQFEDLRRQMHARLPGFGG